jgi:cytoskeleton protein RodZ
MSSDNLAGATAPGPEEDGAAAGAVVAIASLAELVKLRDARGFSASLVSSRLRLAPRQIAALETGDWASLPGRTFIRSSLRSYGRLLEVEVAPLLEAIESELPGTDVLKPDSELNRPLPREGALGFGGNGSGSRWVWMLLLVGGVIALAFFYGGGATLLNRNLKAPASQAPPSGPTGERASQPTDAGAVVSPAASAAQSDPSPQVGGAGAQPGTRPASGVSALTGSAIAGAANPLVSLPGAPASTATATAAGPATAALAPSTAPAPDAPAPSGQAVGQQVGNPKPVSPAPSVAAPPASVAAQGATPAAPPPWPASIVVPRTSGAPGASGGAGVPLNPLVMRFPADSWIEVRDASGAVLITGTQPPGTVRELSGELPLSLIIGNAGGVAVTWRGVPIDLAPHMRQGIARFRIE